MVCVTGSRVLQSLKLIGPLTLTGHWMHHAGTGAGKAAHVPQWGVCADAGLLAERTAAEDGHQGHPQLPAEAGPEPPGLPGHPGLRRPRGCVCQRFPAVHSEEMALEGIVFSSLFLLSLQIFPQKTGQKCFTAARRDERWGWCVNRPS